MSTFGVLHLACRGFSSDLANLTDVWSVHRQQKGRDEVPGGGGWGLWFPQNLQLSAIIASTVDTCSDVSPRRVSKVMCTLFQREGIDFRMTLQGLFFWLQSLVFSTLLTHSEIPVRANQLVRDT